MTARRLDCLFERIAAKVTRIARATGGRVLMCLLVFGGALSPGYEKGNAGFQRGTETRCICHAGRVEAIDSSLHRLRLHAVAIDCERCHGPASLHVERWTAADQPTGKVDVTIVNPRHLTRDQDESICAQCHLNSAAAVDVRGRRLDDFRPGWSLSDFQISFLFRDNTAGRKPAPEHPGVIR